MFCVVVLFMIHFTPLVESCFFVGLLSFGVCGFLFNVLS